MSKKFSERINITQPRNFLQIDGIDSELRVSLWNLLQVVYWERAFRPSVQTSDSLQYNKTVDLFSRKLWIQYFKLPVDERPGTVREVIKYIREYLFSCQWFQVYEFIEFILETAPLKSTDKDSVTEHLNRILEAEKSGYRMLSGEFVRITDDCELQAVEEVLSSESQQVRTHIRRAARLMSDRADPDYRNSVKESISAIESLVVCATGREKGKLSNLVKKLSAVHEIHPALERALILLYGYTSDEGGIRHALLEQEKVTFEDAKLMLILCAGFINYVTGTIAATGASFEVDSGES